MSELTEQRWAVVSERGAEASSLTYQEARRLVRQLADEGLHGLSIITAAAANRISKRMPAKQSGHSQNRLR